MSKVRKFKLYNMEENAFHCKGNYGYTKVWLEAGTFYANDAKFIKSLNPNSVHIIPAEISPEKAIDIVHQIRREFDPEYQEANELYKTRREMNRKLQLNYV